MKWNTWSAKAEESAQTAGVIIMGMTYRQSVTAPKIYIHPFRIMSQNIAALPGIEQQAAIRCPNPKGHAMLSPKGRPS